MLTEPRALRSKTNSQKANHMQTHKRGDTFDVSGVVTLTDNGTPLTDMTGWTGASQLKSTTNGVIASLVFTWQDAAQRLCRITAPSGTSGWPIGVVQMDIQFTSPAGDKVSTQTQQIQIVEGVTHV